MSAIYRKVIKKCRSFVFFYSKLGKNKHPHSAIYFCLLKAHEVKKLCFFFARKRKNTTQSEWDMRQTKNQEDTCFTSLFLLVSFFFVTKKKNNITF